MNTGKKQRSVAAKARKENFDKNKAKANPKCNKITLSTGAEGRRKIKRVPDNGPENSLRRAQEPMAGPTINYFNLQKNCTYKKDPVVVAGQDLALFAG